MAPVPTPPGYSSVTFEAETSRGVITRRVLVLEGRGPSVILMHESPGISSSTLAIAGWLQAAGFRVLLPELLEMPRHGSRRLRDLEGILRICFASEMAALSSSRTGAIVEWLRAYARTVANGGKSRVVVIGMCFSGGFALGAMVEPTVTAAVMSQPSLPFPITRTQRQALGLSESDLAEVQGLRGPGASIRTMRYEGDWMSPSERYGRTQIVFSACERRQVGTAASHRHSVLKDGVVAPTNPDAEVAAAETLKFLRRHLDTPTG